MVGCSAKLTEKEIIDLKVSTVAKSLFKLSDEFSDRLARKVPILEYCDDETLVNAISDNLSTRMIVYLLEVAGQERGKKIFNRVASKLKYPALENSPFEEAKQEQARAIFVKKFSPEELKTESISEKGDNDDDSINYDILPALQDSLSHNKRSQKINLVGTKPSIKRKRQAKGA